MSGWYYKGVKLLFIEEAALVPLQVYILLAQPKPLLISTSMISCAWDWGSLSKLKAIW